MGLSVRSMARNSSDDPFNLGDLTNGLADLLVVGVAGFEPTTSSSRTKRATKLRHTPCVCSGNYSRAARVEGNYLRPPVRCRPSRGGRSRGRPPLVRARATRLTDPMTSADLAPDPLPLARRTVLITGVSRRAGIGHAIACRAAAQGASVVAHHYSPHDAAQAWGADDIDAVMASIASHLSDGARLTPVGADLAASGQPARVVAAAAEAAADVGHPLTALVCNQAMSEPDAPPARHHRGRPRPALGRRRPRFDPSRSGLRPRRRRGAGRRGG